MPGRAPDRGVRLVTPEFWHDRWQRGEIGWHLEQVNPLLEAYWPRLGLPPGGQVLVPLCGKSRDLLWLAAQGHRVVGVELSPVAVAGFFSEQGLQPDRSAEGPFECYQVDEIRLLCGDFFDLAREQVGELAALFDRGSLIALPHELRRPYADRLVALTRADSQGLLITLEYHQAEMAGPPFSVPEEEVAALFGDAFRIERLIDIEVLAENPGLAARGLSRLREGVYRLSPRG